MNGNTISVHGNFFSICRKRDRLRVQTVIIAELNDPQRRHEVPAQSCEGDSALRVGATERCGGRSRHMNGYDTARPYWITTVSQPKRSSMLAVESILNFLQVASHMTTLVGALVMGSTS
jgi:hypothetical protein